MTIFRNQQCSFSFSSGISCRSFLMPSRHDDQLLELIFFNSWRRRELSSGPYHWQQTDVLKETFPNHSDGVWLLPEVFAIDWCVLSVLRSVCGWFAVEQKSALLPTVYRESLEKDLPWNVGLGTSHTIELRLYSPCTHRMDTSSRSAALCAVKDEDVVTWCANY